MPQEQARVNDVPVLQSHLCLFKRFQVA
jgi:hypothetical protein